MFIPKVNYSFIASSLAISTASSAATMIASNQEIFQLIKKLNSSIESSLSALGVDLSGINLVSKKVGEWFSEVIQISQSLKKGIKEINNQIQKWIEFLKTKNLDDLMKVFVFLALLPEMIKSMFEEMFSNTGTGLNSEKLSKLMKHIEFWKLIANLIGLAFNKGLVSQITGDDVKKIADAIGRGETEEQLMEEVKKMEENIKEIKADSNLKDKDKVIKKLTQNVKIEEIITAIIGALVKSVSGDDEAKKGDSEIKNISKQLMSIGSNLFGFLSLLNPNSSQSE